jgi:hypothetical protein
VSHVDDLLLADPAASLFAGLATLPAGKKIGDTTNELRKASRKIASTSVWVACMAADGATNR